MMLEPIVTFSQALKVTSDCVTISSMNIELSEFAKRLNKLCDLDRLPPKGGGRQLELAKIFGVSQKGARKWLEGEGLPKTSRINEIAAHFGVNSEWLLSGRGDMREQEGNYGARENRHSYGAGSGALLCTKVPVISEVKAGRWHEAIDNHHPGDAEEWIETSAKVSKSAFALRVSGDSMVNPYGSPSIPDGSYVIVDPEIEATSGKIVVAKLHDRNEAVLKKLVIDGPNRYLKALNPEYKSIQIDETCVIVGVAKRIEIDL